jgi:hypothetical protein
MAATPGKNSRVVFSANDLKPMSCRLFRYIEGSPPLSLLMSVENSDCAVECKEKSGTYAIFFVVNNP